MNTFGKTIGLTIFGESHGLSIGAVLDGLPSGEAIDWDAVRTEMARRAPGKNKMSTARSEKDAFEVQSGFFNGHTTGTPLCAIIRNSDQHSRDYDQLRHIMRPGHADYSGKIRYGGFNDYRGGGHLLRPSDGAPGLCRCRRFADTGSPRHHCRLPYPAPGRHRRQAL